MKYALLILALAGVGCGQQAANQIPPGCSADKLGIISCVPVVMQSQLKCRCPSDNCDINAKPEPMDVQAVENKVVSGTGIMTNCRPAGGYFASCDEVTRTNIITSCTDTRRVLLTDEAGHKHCILFPPQEAK